MLSALQDRAAGVVPNVSYEATDHNGSVWLNIYNLIVSDLGVFMYKTQKGLVPDGFTDLHLPVTEIHSHNTRSAKKGIPSTNF